MKVDPIPNQQKKIRTCLNRLRLAPHVRLYDVKVKCNLVSTAMKCLQVDMSRCSSADVTVTIRSLQEKPASHEGCHLPAKTSTARSCEQETVAVKTEIDSEACLALQDLICLQTCDDQGSNKSLYFVPKVSKIGSGVQPRALRDEGMQDALKELSPPEHIAASLSGGLFEGLALQDLICLQTSDDQGSNKSLYFVPKVSKIGSGAQPRALRDEGMQDALKELSPPEHIAASLSCQHPLTQAPGLPASIFASASCHKRLLKCGPEDLILSLILGLFGRMLKASNYPDYTLPRELAGGLELTGKFNVRNDVFRAKPIKPKVNSKKSKKVTVMSATELLTGGVEEAYELADIKAPEEVAENTMMDPFSPPQLESIFGGSSVASRRFEVDQGTKALAHLGRVVLAIPVINYLDDYFGVESSATANSAYEAWVWLHRVIDFRLNEKKAVPPFIEIPVLGLDIAIDGDYIVLSVPDDKRAQLISSIDGVLQDDRLPSSTAHKLIEKLTFASGALDTSAPRSYLRVLPKFVSH
ncbi:hypothetical protein Pmar_PMAR009909 [Perkinsus marinus ATCC 50983]|uniref:Uncharacterized protein n=1 Tax=Perkinsus marinus (strain ATCC 50983 / TXsc) TaxID=423536 RepID=C5KIC9_PERM5|nr:hypothetical protein Pmar_PMAR009909 [Perkinsus marinus ATCC 50983]EER15792.1 hypothetical protein Pmar_PMAR009909 [Perkinsus marinus ATCC 50983]|eukprot:XP_002783996.1 hypothetical protein Pmar_PMAR009909 [Perkinsus marinus ATCC 50983]